MTPRILSMPLGRSQVLPRTDVPVLAVIVPTFNERGNVPMLVERLRDTLDGLAWEAIFVDDDSADGTAAVVGELAAHDPRIRLIHRIGRRGLSSALIEGMLATPAQFLVVMDADLQHDESIIPEMLDLARQGNDDLVIATRNRTAGGMGAFCKRRVRLSHLGRKISQVACGCEVSDPMSGFFLIRRSYFLATVHSLHAEGFKTLVDILASGPRPVRVGEVGYTFGARIYGESKLDAHILIDYIFMLAGKLVGRRIPTRFGVFGLVGSVGILLHLACLALLLHGARMTFVGAQITATFTAMTCNYFFNNAITYRDRKLHGTRLLRGLLAFWLACGVGAFANVSVARTLLSLHMPWLWAGLAGVVFSSVWNYAINDLFTWNSAESRA